MYDYKLPTDALEQMPLELLRVELKYCIFKQKMHKDKSAETRMYKNQLQKMIAEKESS